MNESFPKMRFYSLEKSKLEGINKAKTSFENSSKEVKTSKDFNEALTIVIKKDINTLSINLKNIISDITKVFVRNGIVFDSPISTNLDEVDSIISNIEEKISDLIIKKNSIKIGLFSSKKKEKKKNIENLEETLNSISKMQNDIIGIKNEYNKLKVRLNDVESSSFFGEEEKQEEDPLERTINFYMNKENKN